MNNKGFSTIEVIVAPIAIILMLVGMWSLVNIIGLILPKHKINNERVRYDTIQLEQEPLEDYWQNNVR